MAKYIITTGQIRDFKVEADSADEAFKEAILAHEGAALGLIFSVTKEGEEEKFGHTMRTLIKVGLADQPLDELGLPLWQEDMLEDDDILDEEILDEDV